MKGKLFLKRPKVNWHEVMIKYRDPDVFVWFWAHYHYFLDDKVSFNRLCYLALLHVYGKARLDAYRYSGIWSV